jgi:Uma2 family endonuclease
MRREEAGAMIPAMSTPARKLPTFDDLYRQIEQLPEGVTGQILEPGVLSTMSRPGEAHERAHSILGYWLHAFDLRAGGAGWWIRRECELRLLGDRLVVPDYSGWRVDRVPELPNENPMTVVPDWCCAILSPGTAKVDRMLKLPIYATAGVGWVWLVDPDLRTVEVFESVGGRATRVAGARDDERIALPPFGAEVALAEWWPQGG